MELGGIREDKQSPCGCLDYRDKWEAVAALPWGLRGVKCSSGSLWVFSCWIQSKAGTWMLSVFLQASPHCLLPAQPLPQGFISVCCHWHFSLPTSPFSLLLAFPTWAVPCFPPRVTAGSGMLFAVIPSAVSLCHLPLTLPSSLFMALITRTNSPLGSCESDPPRAWWNWYFKMKKFVENRDLVWI